MSDAFASMRAQAESSRLEGRGNEALAMAREVIEARRAAGKAALDDYVLASLCAFQLERWAETAELLREAIGLFPTVAALHENLGVTLGRMDQPKQAIDALMRALEFGSDSANLLDSLAANHAFCRQFDQARVFGVRALEHKHAAALAEGTRHPLTMPPPPFRVDRADANVISYSLWGHDPCYTDGALRNADLARDIYPGWTSRFHVDTSVPQSVLQKLIAYGAEVVTRPAPKQFFDGLFWRFEVMDDPNVDRYLVRDADSLVNTQERNAVDEWLVSDRHFHVMRDWYTHTDLILAGLWGGCARALPPLSTLRAEWRQDRHPTRNADQDFLRRAVWPSVSQSCLVHDSYFDCLASRPFPALGRLPPGWHVGQQLGHRRLSEALAATCRRR